MAQAGLIMAVLGVFLVFIPFSNVTQILGLIISAGAIPLGYFARQNAIEEGRPATTALASLGLGLAAVVIGGLLFVSCKACSGDGEVDQGIEAQFRQSCTKAINSSNPSK